MKQVLPLGILKDLFSLISLSKFKDIHSDMLLVQTNQSKAQFIYNDQNLIIEFEDFVQYTNPNYSFLIPINTLKNITHLKSVEVYQDPSDKYCVLKSGSLTLTSPIFRPQKHIKSIQDLINLEEIQWKGLDQLKNFISIIKNSIFSRGVILHVDDLYTIYMDEGIMVVNAKTIPEAESISPIVIQAHILNKILNLSDIEVANLDNDLIVNYKLGRLFISQGSRLNLRMARTLWGKNIEEGTHILISVEDLQCFNDNMHLFAKSEQVTWINKDDRLCIYSEKTDSSRIDLELPKSRVKGFEKVTLKGNSWNALMAWFKHFKNNPITISKVSKSNIIRVDIDSSYYMYLPCGL